MNIVGMLVLKRFRCAAAVALALGLVVCVNESALAAGGSWGSSRGSFASTGGGSAFGSSGGGAFAGGSSGGWGCSGGGFTFRPRPIRNLLGRLGGGLVRLSNWRLGSRGAWAGCSGGWTGCSGGWSGCSGGWSTPVVSTPVVSAPIVSSPVADCGCWGSSLAAVTSGPTFETSFTQPAINPPNAYYSQESFPVGDQGLQPGLPVFDSAAPDGVILSEPFNSAPITDGGSIDSILEGSPLEGSGSRATPPIPSPIEDGDSTFNTSAPAKETILSLNVPQKAKVYVNGQLTATKGAHRQYVSRGLSDDQDYQYQLKVVLDQDGEELVQTKLVTMRSGLDKTVNFRFDQPVITLLELNVPEDAIVKLCGKDTAAPGSLRQFATKSLKKGQVWKDYKVSVEFEKDGQMVQEERTLDLAAGEKRSLTIGLPSDQLTRVAAR